MSSGNTTHSSTWFISLTGYLCRLEFSSCQLHSRLLRLTIRPPWNHHPLVKRKTFSLCTCNFDLRRFDAHRNLLEKLRFLHHRKYGIPSTNVNPRISIAKIWPARGRTRNGERRPKGLIRKFALSSIWIHTNISSNSNCQPPTLLITKQALW